MLIVVIAFWRGNANQRQGLIVQHRRGVLTPGNETFGNHQPVQAGGFAPGGGQLTWLADLDDADRRAFVCWLDHQRQAQPRFHLGKITVGSQHFVFRGGNAHRLPHQLGAPFVHTNAGGHHAAAGVGQLHQFQRALHRAILTAPAMQGNEHPVKLFIVQRRQRFVCRVKRVGIHPTAQQRIQHRVAAHQRHFALCRTAAKHHCHFAVMGHSASFLTARQ